MIAVGEMLAEFVAVRSDGRPIDGARETPTLFAGPFPSGAPAIAIDQAARCGAHAIMIGSVGEDAFGEAILQRLAEGGTRLDHVGIDPDRPTGTAHVVYRGDGSRRFVFHIAGSAAQSVAVPEAPFRGDAVLLVSGSSVGPPALRAAVLSAVQRVRAAGGRIALDPNVRPELMQDEGARRALDALIASAAILTPSEEDLAALFPDAADPVAPLLSHGAAVVAVTRGPCGVTLISGEETIEIAGHPVEAIDPTGAGDAFTATLVTMLAAGRPLAEAGALANAAGALATTALGPMEGNTGLQRLEDFLMMPAAVDTAARPG